MLFVHGSHEIFPTRANSYDVLAFSLYEIFRTYAGFPTSSGEITPNYALWAAKIDIDLADLIRVRSCEPLFIPSQLNLCDCVSYPLLTREMRVHSERE